MAKPRKIKPKYVNVAIPEAIHKQLLDFADIFSLPVGVTTVRILKSGFKNIIPEEIAILKSRINILEKFNE